MSVSKVGTTVPAQSIVVAATVTPAYASDMPRTVTDVLIARVAAANGGALATVTPGWNAVGADIVSGLMRCNLFYKLATGADIAPTFTSAAAADMFASLEEFTGNDPLAPLQTSSLGSTTITSGSTMTPVGGAAPALPGALSITHSMGHYSADPTTETPDTGWIKSTWTNSSGGADHSGGDNHFDPSTAAPDQELMTFSNSVTSNGVALIATFLPPVGITPGVFWESNFGSPNRGM